MIRSTRRRRWQPQTEPSQFKITRAPNDCAGEIARVFQQSFRAAHPREVLPVSEDEWIDDLDIHIAVDRHGAILGFIAFGSGQITHLYVLPRAQHHGIGSALLAKARTGSLRVQVRQSNLQARTFFERHGFSESRRMTSAPFEIVYERVSTTQYVEEI